MKKTIFFALILFLVPMALMAQGADPAPALPGWAKIASMVTAGFLSLFGGSKWFQKIKKVWVSRRDELATAVRELGEFRMELAEFRVRLKIVTDKLDKNETPTAEDYVGVYDEGKDIPGAFGELWESVKDVISPGKD